MTAFRKVLVPTDFSPGADAAVAQATEMVKALDGEIHLLHAYHLPTYVGSPYGFTYPVGLIDDVRRQALSRLGEIAEKVRSEGVAVTFRIIDGIPSERIVEHAEREHMDLIVMGTRGLSGLAHVFLGSVAERTIRSAPCPVLTVKPAATPS